MQFHHSLICMLCGAGVRAPIPVAEQLARMDNVDTVGDNSCMSKSRTPSPDKVDTATLAIAERSSAVETKGSISLRIDANTRQLIDDAAAILGKTRTEFMVESARRQAIDVLLDQRLFVLNADYYATFMEALDSPPAPGSKLRSLMRRVPAWKS